MAQNIDPNDPLVQTAVFGQQVEQFLSGDIGKYLVRRAENEAEQAADALKTVHPWRTRRIRELQNTIWVAERVQKWLGEAILDGRQALNVLEGVDDE